MRPHTRSLLILEPDDDVRAMLAFHVMSLGHESFPAANGHAAVNLFERHPEITAALLSVGEKRPDAVETSAALREINPRLPIIFMTCGTERYTLGELYAFGVVDVLSKPVGVEELSRVLQRVTPTFRKRQMNHRS